MTPNKKIAQDIADPLIGQVIFTAGTSQEDAWDDSELIDHWDRAKEAYKRRQAQQGKANAPPFGTNKRHMKGRVEKPKASSGKSTGPALSTKKETKPSMQLPFVTPPQSMPMFQQQGQGDSQDALTQMVMAWYYAGYYAGIYAGSNSRGQ